MVRQRSGEEENGGQKGESEKQRKEERDKELKKARKGDIDAHSCTS